MRFIFLFFIFLLVTPASALTIEVQGNYVNEKVNVVLDREAFIIFRMNHGTPIFAEGKTASFIPRITGELYIEAISGEERINRTIEIIQRADSGGGGSTYTLPDGSFTKKAHNTDTVYTVGWRTALGALEKATEILGFDYTVKETSLGLYVDCINGKCEKSEGEKSGWKYWVNYPDESSPGLRADEYELEEGDRVIWYFAKSIDDEPDNSPYKIEIDVNTGFIIGVTSHWSYSASSEKHTHSSVYQALKNNEFSEPVILLPNIEKNIEIPENMIEEFGVTSIKLISPERKEIEVRVDEATVTFYYGGIYRCFRIEGVEGVGGSIEFRVSKEWMERNNCTIEQIKLIKFLDEDFTELPTKYTGEDAEYFYFRSELESFSTFAIVSKWRGFPLDEQNERIQRALMWLKSTQNEDGGFANPGENSSISKTSWAILALVSANQNPYEWRNNSQSPIDYIRKNLKDEIDVMGTTDYALVILALNAAGENPENFSNINLVEKLKSKVKEDGQIGDFIHTTIWGILALKSCGEDVNQSLEWLKEQQNEDGGFGWAIGEKSDYDDTASAIQALIAAGEGRDSEIIRRALEYLRTGQNDDGGFRYFGASASNAASDAWIIQALIAAGENPTKWKKNNVSVVDHLLSLQTDEGFFNYTAIQTSNPGYMTVCAIMALTGSFHPIKAKNYEISKIVSSEEEPYKINFPEKEIIPNFTEEKETITGTATPTVTEKRAIEVGTAIESEERFNTTGVLLATTLILFAIALVAYFRRK